VRDAEGRIVRGPDGIPTLKSTGRKVVDLEGLEGEGEGVEVRFGQGNNDEDGPFERDAEGRIVRGVDGMPRLKAERRPDGEDEDVNEDESDEEDDEDDEWGGFDE
jgi:putative methyltransferase